jgi:hypothetical protein
MKKMKPHLKLAIQPEIRIGKRMERGFEEKNACAFVKKVFFL